MRRIYESNAIHRDDDDPTAPPASAGPDGPQSIRSIDSTAWSRRLVPNALRYRAVSIRIVTPREVYTVGERVPFEVRMKNALPVPVTIETRSPLLWTWHVDGAKAGSRLDSPDPEGDGQGFHFDRGERKRFRKRWNGMFKISENEWEPAAAGEYTIGAGLNVENARGKGLYDELTVRLQPE